LAERGPNFHFAHLSSWHGDRRRYIPHRESLGLRSAETVLVHHFSPLVPLRTPIRYPSRVRCGRRHGVAPGIKCSCIPTFPIEKEHLNAPTSPDALLSIPPSHVPSKDRKLEVSVHIVSCICLCKRGGIVILYVRSYIVAYCPRDLDSRSSPASQRISKTCIFRYPCICKLCPPHSSTAAKESRCPHVTRADLQSLELDQFFWRCWLSKLEQRRHAIIAQISFHRILVHRSAIL